jgi:hypothetical protein
MKQEILSVSDIIFWELRSIADMSFTIIGFYVI